MTALWIGVAGFFGAIGRYAVDSWIGPKSSDAFPFGIFLVNISGSFVLGLLAALFAERFVASESLRLALTVGFLGAYTTFSTFALQTVRLMEEGAPLLALVNVLVSVVVGVAAAYGGLVLGRSIA